MQGTLFLLPNLLGEWSVEASREWLSEGVAKAVFCLHGLMAESERGGRRYLSYFIGQEKARALPIAVVDRHTQKADLDFYLRPLYQGETWGYVSDAGLPCLADPGAALVALAHQKNICVRALAGPSSLVMALMLSGFPAQRFSFSGYLPVEGKARRMALQAMERSSHQEKSTHVWIETPYRADLMLKEAIACLKPSTSLSVAWNLTEADEGVMSKSVKSWFSSPAPDLAGKRAVFSLYA